MGEERFCAEKGINIDSSSKDVRPTFGIVVDGELIVWDDGYNYNGGGSFSIKALHEFCMSNMPNRYINNINNVPQMDERLLLSSLSMPAVLLLTDKYETSSMFYSIAYYYRKDFKFGISRAKNLKLSQKFA